MNVGASDLALLFLLLAGFLLFRLFALFLLLLALLFLLGGLLLFCGVQVQVREINTS